MNEDHPPQPDGENELPVNPAPPIPEAEAAEPAAAPADEPAPSIRRSVHDAFESARGDAARAVETSVPRAHEYAAKAAYHAAYGLAFGAVFGAGLAKAAMPDKLKTAFRKGADAARGQTEGPVILDPTAPVGGAATS